MQKLNISESFICKIWEGGEQFYSKPRTCDGEDVDIISYGIRNFDGGPDYKNAKFRIGGKVLVGDVEIHRQFKDWEQHKHKSDRRYNSVILHLVMWDSEQRTEPRLQARRRLPTIILSHFLKRSIHDIWQEIIDNPDRRFKLPCADLNSKVDDQVVQSFLQKLALQRLEMKSLRMRERLKELESERGALRHAIDEQYKLKYFQDWEQVLYEFVFEALGYSKNKEPMMKLAKNLRLEKIKEVLAGKHTPQRAETRSLLRALIFGASGFLFDLKLRNKYANRLRTVWNQYRHKLKIPLMLKTEWQFFRLRPPNFPSLRLAYGCEFLLELAWGKFCQQVINLFNNSLFEPRSVFRELVGLFHKLAYAGSESVRDYLSILDSKEIFGIGKERINGIVVNVIIPFTYLHGKIFDNKRIRSNALRLYNEVSTRENNSVLRLMKNQLMHGRSVKISTPALEQGLTHLYNFYCTREKCLDCEIGNKVFKGSGYEYRIIFY